MKPRLLDLFCGAGGCSVGYARAGFDVVGVDIEQHADYSYELVVANAMVVLEDVNYLNKFDVVHASPPCPRYSSATPQTNRNSHPDFLPLAREALKRWGGAYVIENVVGAPMPQGVLFCGKAMGLPHIRRHRLFESNMMIMSPGCACDGKQAYGIYGAHADRVGGWLRPNGKSRGIKATSVTHAQQVMGIDWMTKWEDLADAIPPAYTECIGEQLLDQLKEVA